MRRMGPRNLPERQAVGRRQAVRPRHRPRRRSNRCSPSLPGNAAVPDDLDRFIAGAEAAADVAGAVVRPFFRSSLSVDTKSDRSPVTVADRSAEKAMRAVLAERFPDHGVLGEEFGLDRPEAKLRWVLDPIDGTR